MRILGLLGLAACAELVPGVPPGCADACAARADRAQQCVDGGEATWAQWRAEDAADLALGCETWAATARRLEDRDSLDLTEAACAALPGPEASCDALDLPFDTPPWAAP